MLGRAAAKGAAHETASLPAALITRPMPPAPDESPADALIHLQDGSEQLLRAAYEAIRTSDVPHPSGSDWPQLARSLALTRLLSADLLAHTDSDAVPLPSLAQAARHWHAVAEAWHHLVDPTAHPLLPQDEARLRRQGKASPCPCHLALTRSAPSPPT